MTSIKSNQIISFGILILFATALTGCGDIELKSTWLDREIVVDGAPDDWEDLMLIIKDKNFTIGLANDENFLYLCLRSFEESTLRQAMLSGFTVWFDAEGGKQRKFGIKFPVGMQAGALPVKNMREMTQTPDAKAQEGLIAASLREVEIIGPGKGERVRASSFLEKGIEVKVGQTQGQFVYELKIPLLKTSDHSYAVGAQEGKPLRIGLETGKTERDKMREEMMKGGMPPGGGGMPSGGMPPGGGRMPGGGVGRPGDRPEMPEPLELWVKVNLAERHSTDSGTP